MPRPAPAYLLSAMATAAAVGAIWGVAARTEGHCMKSIVDMAVGGSPRPFVERRLLVDSARVVSAAIPPAAWRALDRALAPGGPAAGPGAWLRRFGWRSEDTPLLLTAHVLIGLSAFGFILTMRAMILANYDCRGWTAEALSLALGVALLGGYGDGHYYMYSYDLPNAFVFYLALTLFMLGSPWAFGAFALATVSKETSVLLILAFLLLSMRPIRSRLLVAAAMAGVYAAVRVWIQWRFPPTPEWTYWFPRRNAYVMANWVLWNSWSALILAVAAARIALDWRLVPPMIRVGWVFVPVMLGMAAFQAWFEELRQYLEVMPVLALPAIQWAARSLRLEAWFRPRLADGAASGSLAVELRRGPLRGRLGREPAHLA